MAVTRHAEVESALFSALNSLVEPVARAGWLSSAFCPVGVIVLETTGRRSGRAHRVAVLAITTGQTLLVTTAQGDRSDWFRNIEAHTDVRYWTGKQVREARAVVLRDGDTGAELPEASACALLSMSAPARLMGWRFAVLLPGIR